MKIPTNKLLADKGQWWMVQMDQFDKPQLMLIKRSLPEQVLLKIDGPVGCWVPRNLLVEPLIGMGLTQSVGSDSYPWTVVGVSKSGKRITVQRDNFTRTDKNGFSEQQTYNITPNTKGEVAILIRRKDGTWFNSSCGGRFHLGFRKAYQDPSF